ncbi:MAG: GHKL domain-containing protein [Eubacteriales bacterium]|nr:GHKL domain-containing protein [Eubacteriales bacterium]
MGRIAVDLSNTPGIYYVIAYFLSSCLYIAVNPKRLTGVRRAGVQLAFLLVLGAFMVATDGIDRRFFIPCVLTEVLLLGLSLYLCCRLDWKKAVYFTIRAFMLGEFAASLEWQLFYFGLTNWNLRLHMGWNLLFLLVSHGAVFAVMYFLERNYREENEALRITGRELLVSLFLGISVYAVSNVSYAMQGTPFSSQFPAEIFIIRTLADLGGVGMLYAYHMQLQELQARVEKNFLQSMLELQYENYKNSAESVALVNQKYHDLKHQIAYLRNVVDTEEKNAYLDQMEQEIRSYEAQNKTGNKVLDTILTTKSLQCQRQGISLTCVADGKEIGFMNPMDISALFGNALDNAIESVKKISDPEKRLIHLSVSKQKNFVRIRVENCFEGEIRFENGIPVTSKKDKAFHGFGTRSIRRIAEKYGGSMTIDTRGDWFELRVLLPV